MKIQSNQITFQKIPQIKIREELEHEYKMAINVIKQIPVGIPIVLTMSHNIDTITTLCIIKDLFKEIMQVEVIASSDTFPITHPKYLNVITWKKLKKEDMPLYVNMKTKYFLFDELMKKEWIFT